MARKSRKNLHENKVNVAPAIVADFNKKLPTAAYARLSVEKGESDSIQTQMTLLKQYIEQTPDLELTEIYVDNGYTGTNFERPDFIRMMDDVRHGKIQCIVVKDLSRFGRDFLETGYYIETIFPRLNVRFISVNDEFDSFREGDIDNIAVPIKNMVNEMYAKDFSRKVTAYNDLHRARGDVKLLRSVYGYKRDVENNIYVVNPDTAPIVQLIFRWYLMGVGPTKIAERLNAMNVLTPLAYKTIVEKGEEFTQEDKWNSSRVRDILHRSIYIGDLVWGRRRKTLFRGIPEHKTPKEEWVVWHNMHEPIIAKTDFEEVQRLLEDKNYRKKSEGKYDDFANAKDYFKGKVYCMDCKKKMRYMKYCYGNRDGGYYYCGCKDANVSNPEQSVLWKVHADYLKIVVTDQINNLVKWMCDHRKLAIQLQKELKNDGTTTKIQRKRMQLKIKLEQIEEKQASMYEDFSQGIIDADDYKLLKEKKLAEREEIRKELQETEEELLIIKRQIKEFVRIEKHLEEYLGQTSFQEKLAKELVENIHVSQENGIEIRFKCADVIEQVFALEEEVKM